MKRKVLGLLLFLLIVPMFMACDQKTTVISTTTEKFTTTTQASITTEKVTTTSQLTELATQGTVTINIVINGDDPKTGDIVEESYVANSITVGFYENETLFDVLLANFTMTCQGEDGNPDDTCSFMSEWGHYVLSIDALVPDPNNNEFISFYINDEYAPTGVDATVLHDGYVFRFEIGTY